MPVEMTVAMSTAAGRRYGGRSKYTQPLQFNNRRAAINDLWETFGGIHNQTIDEYIADLARVGIVVEIKEI